MTLATKARFTPAELERLPDAVNYELVGGNLVDRHMGSESSAIALKIGYLLLAFIQPKRLGHVFTTDCGYQCFPTDPGKVRKPDVSFVARGRLPNDQPPKGYVRLAPDLAVEVISPGDLASDIEDKVNEYLAAGVKLIWVVSPTGKTVRVHGPGAPPGRTDPYSESETITGGDVLHGFECRVAEFFQI
jgi:Uma2 family endonuclease